MAILEIKYFGDPALRQVSSPIEQINGELVRFASNLIETMQVCNGIGLAANQVGRAIRMYAVDPSMTNPEEKSFVLLNPRIVKTDGEQVGEEGCLSFPGLYEQMTRPDQVLVEATGIDGKPIRLEKDGLMARVLIHEYDHLDGKLFIDHFNFLRKQMIGGKLRKLRAGDVEVFR